MKRILMVCALVGWASVATAQSSWQYGRIESVKKSLTNSTKAWVTNHPLDEDQTRYTIAVQVQDKLMIGTYDPSPTQPEPPLEWGPGLAVQLEVGNDSLYLRSAAGSVRLHITKQKTAGPMAPITTEEKKRLAELDAAAESMVGYSKEGEDKAGAPEATRPPAASSGPSKGTVTVRSTPFLSEVFVDGESMGYTPAKMELAPGKHSVRVEKTGYRIWTQEMTITAGSERTLDATLGKK